MDSRKECVALLATLTRWQEEFCAQNEHNYKSGKISYEEFVERMNQLKRNEKLLHELRCKCYD